MADDRQQRHFAFAVAMRLPMLNVNHTDHFIGGWRHDWNRQECFVLVLWKCVKYFEPAVPACVPGDCDRLDFLRYPSRDSLANAHRNLTDQTWMRILRSTQHQV